MREVFRRQAGHFEALGSPVYARLAERLADDPAPAQPILDGDEGWDAALRLFGAVHYLALSGAAPDALSGAWDDFAAALAEHADELRIRTREQGVQTNEVQRCVALLPAFLSITAEAGLPLELLELGPSAGLNLPLDRYRYRYANGRWGAEGATLELVASERGGKVPARLLAQPLDIRRRRGIDLAPVDATTREGHVLLRSFLWPGLEDRVHRLEAAVATLRSTPDRPELIAGDYVELLPGLLAERPEDAVTVVFQTASTGYLPAEAAARLREGLEAAGGDGRPLAWVSTRRRDERHDAEDDHELRLDHWELELRVWPGPARVAATLDFHGNWLDWVLSRKAESAGADPPRGIPRLRRGQIPEGAGFAVATASWRPARCETVSLMITSRDNETLKLVRKLLAQRKHRDETGLFAVEGEDLVIAAREAGIEPAHLLVAGETVEAALLARVSTLPHPARTIGVYRRADLPSGVRETCLALWRLSDPGNVGTLLRTADAFGACVALSGGCADPLSPKALRASAGAIFRVPLVAWADRPQRCVALVAHGGAALSTADLAPPVTILLGAERTGLPDEQVTDCYAATIAVARGAESLNVAAAGAIALYEASRAAA